MCFHLYPTPAIFFLWTFFLLGKWHLNKYQFGSLSRKKKSILKLCDYISHDQIASLVNVILIGT